LSILRLSFVGGTRSPSALDRARDSTIHHVSESAAFCWSSLRSVNWQFTMFACYTAGFPSKLHHEVPSWVEDGALFHIRIALNRTAEQKALTEPTLAPSNSRFRKTLSRETEMVHHTVSLDAGPFAYACLLLQRPRHESGDR
jgi:hypothetical protein